LKYIDIISKNDVNLDVCSFQILQTTIKEKDQTVSDQALVIARLTEKVEANDETLTALQDQVNKADLDLKHERERFNIRLTESQRYFEETLKEQEGEIGKLRKTVSEKESQLQQAEADLREVLSRHERDIQRVIGQAQGAGGGARDELMSLLEGRLAETSTVLEAKLTAVAALQDEVKKREKEVAEARDLQRAFKEKLQQISEQLVLSQASFTEAEESWRAERARFESRVAELVEKHETELSEKVLALESIKSASAQIETAYSQSVEQYSSLQERYHQLAMHGKSDGQGTGEVHVSNDIVDKLKSELKVKEQEVEELMCFKQKSETATEMLRSKEAEIAALHKQLQDRDTGSDKVLKEDSGAKGGDTKMLKMKAQLTAKVKALEKEVAQLKKVDMAFFLCPLHSKNGGGALSVTPVRASVRLSVIKIWCPLNNF